MSTYIIPVTVKEELQKRLEKLSRKAKTYGNRFEYSFGSETVVTRDVYTVDPDGIHQSKTGTENVFGIEITIDSDIIRKAGYTVIAGIEHNAAGNVVSKFDDSYPTNLDWYTMPAYCEHCNSRHAKRYTFIVKDEHGNCKQVGKSCLKDYCGIDPEWIAAAQQITDLIVHEYDIDSYDYTGSCDYAYDVLDVIAIANDIISKYGYVKSTENNSTKSRLFSQIGYEPTKESKKLAEEMKAFFSGLDLFDLTDYQRNVKILIESGYVRSSSFGFLAYAPVCYKQMKEKMERDQIREESKGVSQYVGNVGERITETVKSSVLVSSFETMYGMTWLYKFTTSEDNTLVWFSSKHIDGAPGKITGTVKDHKEYNGEKQTVLTRCKVM